MRGPNNTPSTLNKLVKRFFFISYSFCAADYNFTVSFRPTDGRVNGNNITSCSKWLSKFSFIGHNKCALNCLFGQDQFINFRFCCVNSNIVFNQSICCPNIRICNISKLLNLSVSNISGVTTNKCCSQDSIDRPSSSRWFDKLIFRVRNRNILTIKEFEEITKGK